MDIDLVYLWVDGTDPAWLAKKNACLPAGEQVRADVAGECRYVENDELRYSLRSVERYAPWVRRIYIVTDEQTPPWLDTSNPRVRIVSHREIMPAEILPVFNSTVIELYLPQIPGLAEHFLYANDDMFFNAPVGPDFFFDAAGRPVVRLKKQSLKRHDDDIYCHTILRMQELVRARRGHCCPLAPHHNIDAYRRSDYLDCLAAYGGALAGAGQARFRTADDWQRSLVLYDALAQGRATLREVTRYNKLGSFGERFRAAFGFGCGSDSRCIPAYTPDPGSVLEKYAPSLFCLNDDARMTDADRRRIRRFLQERFPEKSSFEK